MLHQALKDRIKHRIDLSDKYARAARAQLAQIATNSVQDMHNDS